MLLDILVWELPDADRAVVYARSDASTKATDLTYSVCPCNDHATIYSSERPRDKRFRGRSKGRPTHHLCCLLAEHVGLTGRPHITCLYITDTDCDDCKCRIRSECGMRGSSAYTLHRLELSMMRTACKKDQNPRGCVIIKVKQRVYTRPRVIFGDRQRV